MPEINAPLLLKTIEHIENHPEEHDQTRWICDTTACFAGRAVLLDGGDYVTGALLEARDDDPQDDVVAGYISVRDRARRILGLTHRQAEALFDSGNTVEDLQARVYRLVGDFDKLAELVERLAVTAIDGEAILPNALGHPDMDLDDVHLRWDDVQYAITVWQKAEDGETDLATLEPELRDAETYAHRTRGVVDEAIRPQGHREVGVRNSRSVCLTTYSGPHCPNCGWWKK